MECENVKRTDHWPYAVKCRNQGKRRRVIVGKTAGTWDPIIEDHVICDSCYSEMEIPAVDEA